MTAHTKLGTIVAAAFLVLALSGGAAMAGQSGWQGNSQGEEWQSRHTQDDGHRNHAHKKSHKKGKAYGQHAKRYEQRNGENWHPKAYGYRGRNNYLYGNGYLFNNPNQGDHRAQAYQRRHKHVHRDYRYQQRWRDNSWFQFGQPDRRYDRRNDQRAYSGSNFDGGGSCYMHKRKQTVDGQKRLIVKKVCQKANGKTYAVPGSRVVYLLD
jgi:hypothetical protein